MTHRLHLAPDGNDRNPGTRVRPLGTVHGAQRAARKHSAPVTIIVHDGIYELDETLVFTPADSGQRWTAAPGAKPQFSGGRRLVGWTVGAHAGQTAWTLDLPGVLDRGWNFTQLWVDGQRRNRPRLPKVGFFRFSGLDGQGDSGYTWNAGPVRAEYPAGSLSRFSNLDDVGVIAYQLWFDMHHRIKQLDEQKRIVHFEATSIGSLCDESGQFARFFLTNVAEALDQPGEWYLDRSRGQLSYLPLPGETLENVTVIVPLLTELVRFQGNGRSAVTGVVLENLFFAHNEWQRPRATCGVVQAATDVPAAITFERAEQCVLFGCELAHCAGWGIEMLVGSHANTVAACTIRDVGAGAVKIGHEDLQAHDPAVGQTTSTAKRWLRPIAATIADCHLHDGGHIYPSAPGVWIGNSGGNRLMHNHIHHFAYTGVSLGWSWGYQPTRAWDNRIEYNHIHHINHQRVLSDNGGIYILGLQPGSTVVGNHLHDVACYHYGGSGLYPDEGSSGILFADNCVHDVQNCGLYIHYGRFLTFRNNIFACMDKEMLNPGLAIKSCGQRFEGNLVWFDRGNLKQAGEWEPTVCSSQRNLLWNAGTGGVAWPKGELIHEQSAGRWLDTIEADPLFADPRSGDFTLRTDSPALALGFQPFNWRVAGVRAAVVRPATWRAYRPPIAPAKAVAVARLELDHQTLTAEGAELQVRVIVTNPSHRHVHGRWRLQIAGEQPGRMSVAGETRLVIPLAPGASVTKTLVVRVGAGKGLQWLQAVGDERICFSGALPISIAPQVAMPRLTTESELVSDRATGLDLTLIQAGTTLLVGKAALIGATLAVDVTIHEGRIASNRQTPYLGSSLEIFAGPVPSSDARTRPRGVICLPPDSSGPGEIRRGDSNPVARSAWNISTVTEGWRVRLRLPLHELGIADDADGFRLDLILNVNSPVPGQNLLKLPLWGSLNDHQDIDALARVVITT